VGEEPAPADDIYALGVLLYEAVAAVLRRRHLPANSRVHPETAQSVSIDRRGAPPEGVGRRHPGVPRKETAPPGWVCERGGRCLGPWTLSLDRSRSPSSRSG